VAATPDYYAEVLEAFPDAESVTVLFVGGATAAGVSATLGLDLASTVDPDEVVGDDQVTAWALVEVPGGVVAVEPTGFGDPTRTVLAALSSDGHSAAVVRTNVLAHVRFGCARDGRLLFDDNEYVYVEDPEVVPSELRSLFDLAWDDLSTDPTGDEGAEDDDEDDDGPDAVVVGLAMAELVTGVELTPGQVEALVESAYHPGPPPRYADDLA
jgi:hypothetical protein